MSRSHSRDARKRPGRGSCKGAAALAAALVIGFAQPAMAASEPATRLVNCGSQSCLLISGRRADMASTVGINGHRVSAEGKRNWRVILPVETIREWSEPYARTIDVALIDAGTSETTVAQADLPIGLLSHVPTLASLVVRAP